MRYKHQSDLAWRFLHANVELSYVPSASFVLARTLELCGASSGKVPAARITEAQLESRERAGRIDAVLAKISPQHSRVLRLRYGFEEEIPVLKQVLPNMSGVATVCPVAADWYERAKGEAARPRSNDVRNFLESICARVSVRKATREDERALAQIRVDAEKVLVEAETAYESAADRFDRRTGTWAA